MTVGEVIEVKAGSFWAARRLWRTGITGRFGARAVGTFLPTLLSGGSAAGLLMQSFGSSFLLKKLCTSPWGAQIHCFEENLYTLSWKEERWEGWEDLGGLAVGQGWLPKKWVSPCVINIYLSHHWPWICPAKSFGPLPQCLEVFSFMDWTSAYSSVSGAFGHSSTPEQVGGELGEGGVSHDCRKRMSYEANAELAS